MISDWSGETDNEKKTRRNGHAGMGENKRKLEMRDPIHDLYLEEKEVFLADRPKVAAADLSKALIEGAL